MFVAAVEEAEKFVDEKIRRLPLASFARTHLSCKAESKPSLVKSSSKK